MNYSILFIAVNRKGKPKHASIENNIMHPFNPFHIYARQHKKYENNDWFSGKLHLLKCKLVAIIYLLTKKEIHPC